MTLFLQLLFKNLYRFFTVPAHRQFYLLVLKLSGKKRYQPGHTAVGGYRINYTDSLSFIWQYSEIFKEQYYYFKAENNTPLIYDCGSNIGSSCLYFKRLYPGAHILAFEADPAIAKILQQNLTQNGFNDVVVRNEAVWINNEGIELATDGADGASVYTTNEAKTIRIGSVRLKELLDKEQRPIDFLKMDIEGAEKKVIADCGESLQKIKHLFIEYHDFKGVQQDLDTILKTLTQHGFIYYVLNAQTHQAPFLLLDKNKPLQLNIFAKRLP